MVYQHKNVIVGAADVFISVADSTATGVTWWKADGSVGPVLPAGAKSATGPKAKIALEGASADWRHTGLTTDGVEVSFEPDFGEVTADQVLDSVKMFKQAMRVSVNTTLLEATLENLLVAWGQQSDTLTASGLGIASGELGDEPVERSLAFIGQAPRGASGPQERVYHIRRALQVESSSFSLSRTDATTFPVSFRCLPDLHSANSGSEYGMIYQRIVS